MRCQSSRLPFALRQTAGLYVLLAVALLWLAACGGDDVASGQMSCNFDGDCSLGQVCSTASDLCVTAACEFCTEDQICYISESNPEGSCSAPQCFRNDDCPEPDENCVGGVCQSGNPGGCSTSTDCPGDQICNLVNQCVDPVPTDTPDCTDDVDCPEGERCNENEECVPEDVTPEDCTTLECSQNERCIDGQGCVHDCISDPGLCTAAEVCSQATATCMANPCPGQDGSQCGGSTPHFNPGLNCSCVQCLDDTHCTGGKTCNSNGQCTGECQTTCDPGTPGTCAGSTPYCISNCCAECVGAADCQQGQLCIDGYCGSAPDCSVDPTICPPGYECNNGTCAPPASGASCDPQDPTSCPDMQFCNNGTCEGLGGGAFCGLCNPDCTCDNGLTCDGFFCSGCTLTLEDALTGNLQGNCPSGQICFPFLDACL